MRLFICNCLVVVSASIGMADLPDLPISDTRIKVGILVREDIFAGWRSNNLERLDRAEQNIEQLLQQRPQRRGELLAWRGGATLYRAIAAIESGDKEQFENLYRKALDDFEQAVQAAPEDAAVRAIIGGSYAVFGDQIPEQHRDKAWQQSYDNYQALWKMQSGFVAHLPNHIKGELLAGLIQSSQRTGRTDELNQFLDKAIALLPETRYSAMAQRWKDDPSVAANENISCKSCHSPGRLAPTMRQLSANE